MLKALYRATIRTNDWEAILVHPGAANRSLPRMTSQRNSFMQRVNNMLVLFIHYVIVYYSSDH